MVKTWIYDYTTNIDSIKHVPYYLCGQMLGIFFGNAKILFVSNYSFETELTILNKWNSETKPTTTIILGDF